MDLQQAFGPGDITAIAIVPGRSYVLKEVINFSISTHFDKIPIRRLGHSLVVGFATGAGTVAGTLVCAQLNQGALYKLRRHAGAIRVLREEGTFLSEAGSQEGHIRAKLNFYTAGILPQQLPSFHLMFVHVNGEGDMAISRLYGVQITTTGIVSGAHNAFTEDTLQFQAEFYEQLQLHRSLTTEEIVRLANKQEGFFPSYYSRPDPGALLPHERELFGLEAPVVGAAGGLNYLVNTITGEEYALDEVGRYVLDEVELTERRASLGKYTAQSIADTGEVVYVDLRKKYLRTNEDGEEEEVPETVKATRHETGTEPPADTPPELYRYTITQPILTKGGGVLSTISDVYLQESRAWLLKSGAEVPDPATSPPTHSLSGSSLTLSGEAYAQYAGSQTSQLLLPNTLTLTPSADRSSMTAQIVYTPSTPLATAAAAPTEYAGTYETSSGYNESYTIDESMNVTGNLGPFSVVSSSGGPDLFTLQLGGESANGAFVQLRRVEGSTPFYVRTSGGSNLPDDVLYRYNGAGTAEKLDEDSWRIVVNPDVAMDLTVELDAPYTQASVTLQSGETTFSANVATSTTTSGHTRVAHQFSKGPFIEVGFFPNATVNHTATASIHYRAVQTVCTNSSPAEVATKLVGNWRGFDVEVLVEEEDISGQIGSFTFPGTAKLGTPFELVFGSGSGIYATVTSDTLTVEADAVIASGTVVEDD